MENNFKIKGLLNQHLKIQLDEENIYNGRNTNVYGQILNGNEKSAAMDYLLNLGYMRLNDAKSIGMYNELNIAANINHCREYEDIKDENTIYLNKKCLKIRKNIADCIEQRHSGRQFAGTTMGFKEFSTICKYSFGQAQRIMNYGGIMSSTRYYASGGGLYPISIYLYINNVAGLKRGIYRYQVATHSLYPIKKEFNVSKFLQFGNFDFENYSFLVLYEYDFNKNYLKYGELSLLTTLVEVGIISHNFELVSTALDFAACQIAGFDKQYAEAELDLDGINSHILFTNICGKE